MNKENQIKEALSLASKSTTRTLRSRIEEHYIEIEETISSGVNHQKIVEILNDKGIKIGINTFRDVLQSLRKKNNYKNNKPGFKENITKSKKSDLENIKEEIQKIKNSNNDLDLDKLAKIGRNKMRDKLKDKKE